jgi:hypothetical protein
MFFTRSSVSDIEKYYCKTYVKFKEFGDRLFWINRVLDDRVVGHDQDEQEFELMLADEYPYEVDFILPNRAVFQYKDRALLLQRVPMRQYKRGLCEQNIQVVDTTTGSKMDFGFPLLKAFVTKQRYFTFTEAIQRKNSKTKGYALNSRMSMSNNHLLRVDTTPIGEFIDGVLKVNRLFVDDVKRQIADNNESVKVVAYE